MKALQGIMDLPACRAAVEMPAICDAHSDSDAVVCSQGSGSDKPPFVAARPSHGTNLAVSGATAIVHFAFSVPFLIAKQKSFKWGWGGWVSV